MASRRNYANHVDSINPGGWVRCQFGLVANRDRANDYQYVQQ